MDMVSETMDNTMIDGLDRLYKIYAVISSHAREGDEWKIVSLRLFKIIKIFENSYFALANAGYRLSFGGKGLLKKMEEAAKKGDISFLISIFQKIEYNIEKIKILNNFFFRHICTYSILILLSVLLTIAVMPYVNNILYTVAMVLSAGLAMGSVLLCRSPYSHHIKLLSLIILYAVVLYISLFTPTQLSIWVYYGIIISWLAVVSSIIETKKIAQLYMNALSVLANEPFVEDQY